MERGARAPGAVPAGVPARPTPALLRAAGTRAAHSIHVAHQRGLYTATSIHVALPKVAHTATSIHVAFQRPGRGHAPARGCCRQWPRLTDAAASLTDMSHEYPNLGDRPPQIPAARRPQREVGIRELVRTEDRSSALQEWLNELTVTSALSRAEVPRTIRRNNHRDTGERTLRRSTVLYLCSGMLSKPSRIFASTSEMRRPSLCHTTAVTSERLLERITIDPAVCHGQPCIRGPGCSSPSCSMHWLLVSDRVRSLRNTLR